MKFLGKFQELLSGKKSWIGLVLGVLVFLGGNLGYVTPAQTDMGLKVAALIFGAGITAKAARIAKALKA